MRVVVFGAGRRVRGAVLPALRCLAPRFTIEAVVSRRAQQLAIGDATITTRCVDDVDLSRAELIVVAVTLASVPAVLARLARAPVRDAVLVLDTPVVPPRHVAALRYARRFRRVVVAEDTLALPPFVLARRLIERGAIGRLRQIWFFHNGYKYHALASLKQLAGRVAIERIVDRRYPGRLRHKTLDLAGGVHATMYEPRDYAVGKFRIDGDAGVIADYDAPGARRIGYQLDGPLYRGLLLDGVPVVPDATDRAYLAHVDARVHGCSPMNTMKLRGLIDILSAAVESTSPYHYDPVEAVADNLAITMADRAGFAWPAATERLLARGLAVAGWWRSAERSGVIRQPTWV